MYIYKVLYGIIEFGHLDYIIFAFATIILFCQLHDPYAVWTQCRPCSEPAEVWMWMGQDSCHHRSQGLGGCLLGGDRTNKTGKIVQQILVSKYSKHTLWFTPTKTRMPTRDMRIGPTIIAYDQLMISLRYCMVGDFNTLLLSIPIWKRWTWLVPETTNQLRNPDVPLEVPRLYIKK